LRIVAGQHFLSDETRGYKKRRRAGATTNEAFYLFRTRANNGHVFAGYRTGGGTDEMTANAHREAQHGIIRLWLASVPPSLPLCLVRSRSPHPAAIPVLRFSTPLPIWAYRLLVFALFVQGPCRVWFPMISLPQPTRPRASHDPPTGMAGRDLGLSLTLLRGQTPLMQHTTRARTSPH
jgi:hypothetical protein